MRLFIAALFLFLPVSVYCSESVFVLANKNVKESADLAAQYCALRGIGQENIILLDVKNAPNISRADYRLRVASPVFETLKARGMFSASGVYPKVSVFANRAKYVVLCKGLPYRILEDAPAGAPKPDAHSNNSACLDSELALLLEGDYSLSNFRLNKSFKAGVYSPMLNQLIVARLDGITYADALNLVKSAIYAEQNGLRGRVYIDKSKKYPAGDEWLSAAEKILSDKGFDITADEKPACMDYFFRFDAPVFYLGWYASSPVYYFKSDLVKFAPGASALHIYSFAASNLASKKTWAPNLVSHAPAAAFGYTDEPFLIGTHRPDIYVAALASGKTAGESAFLAMFAFSWKGMFLGDPLYRPFSVPLERQLKFIEGGKVDGFSQYAVIRAMNLASDSSEAVQIGLRFLPRLSESYALEWRLARELKKLGRVSEAGRRARRALAQIEAGFAKNPALFGLMDEVAKFLRKEYGENTQALYANAIRSQIGKDEDFLKYVLPKLLARGAFSGEDKAEFEALNARLNLPAKKK